MEKLKRKFKVGDRVIVKINHKMKYRVAFGWSNKMDDLDLTTHVISGVLNGSVMKNRINNGYTLRDDNYNLIWSDEFLFNAKPKLKYINKYL